MWGNRGLQHQLILLNSRDFGGVDGGTHSNVPTKLIRVLQYVGCVGQTAVSKQSRFGVDKCSRNRLKSKQVKYLSVLV